VGVRAAGVTPAAASFEALDRSVTPAVINSGEV